MADELTIAMILRLRSNANAVNRSADRCERMLNETRFLEPAPRPGPGFDGAEVRAAILSSIANQLPIGASVPRPRPGDLAGMMRPNKR